MSEPSQELRLQAAQSQNITPLELHMMPRDELVVRLYFGMGRTGFTEKARAELHPFTLEGPVAPFVTAR